MRTGDPIPSNLGPLFSAIYNFYNKYLKIQQARTPKIICTKPLFIIAYQSPYIQYEHTLYLSKAMYRYASIELIKTYIQT